MRRLQLLEYLGSMNIYEPVAVLVNGQQLQYGDDYIRVGNQFYIGGNGTGDHQQAMLQKIILPRTLKELPDKARMAMSGEEVMRWEQARDEIHKSK